MNMKPLPKMLFAFTLLMLTVVGVKAGINHGVIPTPGIMAAVTPQPTTKYVKTDLWTWNAKDNTVVHRDSDWYLAQQIAHDNGYSYGEDGLISEYRQPDDTTGYPALDKVLRYVWNHVGTLMLVFGLLAGISILGSRLNADSDTHNEQMRREAEELEQPGLSDDIHEPFNAPEGMQPASQYVPVRTRGRGPF
jgi:hypothetical protein